MAGIKHPAADVYPSGSNVAKADVIALAKRTNMEVADADEIRNGDWLGQYGLLFVASLSGWFKIDTSDTTTADNGVNCIVDANGLRFKLVPTGGVTFRDETTSGNVTLLVTDDVVRLKPTVPQARQVTIPAGITKTLTVRDTSRVWATYNCRFVGSGGATINGATYWDGTIDAGEFTFTPDGAGNIEARGVG